MKKVILLTGILCVLNISMLTAQTDQGKFLIGVSSSLGFAGNGSNLMSLEFSTSKYKSDAAGFVESNPYKTTSFNLLPKVGYFVKSNLAVGLDISMGISDLTYNTSTHETTSRSTLFGVGPFVRYYVPMSKVIPFFEIGVSPGSIKGSNNYDGDSSNSTTNFMAYGGGMGLAAPLGERVTFDVMLNYRYLTTKDKDDNPNNERTVNSTFGLKVGFTIYLGGHKDKAVAL